MSKITMNNLLSDYFKSDDTLTVNAAELQNILCSKNLSIIELENENKKLTEKCVAYKNKIDRLENEASCSSTYKLDLSA